MSYEAILAIGLIVGMFVLLFLGMEVGFAIGIVAGIGLLLIGQPLNQLGWKQFITSNNFIFAATPLFVIMGAILAHTGIADMIYASFEKWLGFLPGSLASATIGTDAVFAAMSGSTIAAVATIGTIAYPPMEKRGYDPRLSLSCIALGGCLAPLIPPSLLMIAYGAWAQVSIVDLFAGGVVPGIILTLMFIGNIAVWVKLNPQIAPRPMVKFSFREKVNSTKGMLPFVFIVVGTLGSIFGGIVTPTEGGAVGAFLSIVAAYVCKRLSMAAFKDSLVDSVLVTSFIMFIFAMAISLVHVFNILGLTNNIADFVISLNPSPTLVVVLLVLMYLLLGCILSSWECLFLTVGFVLPIVEALDINLVWWGVIFVQIADVGAVTPPYGMALFTLQGILPQHSTGTIVSGALRLFPAVFITIGLTIAFPQTVLWLPGLFR